MDIIRFILGIFFIISIAYFFSGDKKNIKWRLVLTGILLQIFFAILISKVQFVENIFKSISEIFVIIIGFSKDGTLFLFPNAEFSGFAFNALPVVILFSGLSAVLYYLGIFTSYCEIYCLGYV